MLERRKKVNFIPMEVFIRFGVLYILLGTSFETTPMNFIPLKNLVFSKLGYGKCQISIGLGYWVLPEFL